ncbi:cell division protein ZapA [Aquabacterium sp.]|uniref:cell division protein ZapA n=1 Tax=Aquabacterium sp. TaxID=1872578 RepID=UPI002489B9AE|nr:cell division protein ZapA [Aquabacterium sp.]MDI1258378.1 cell division protein ZapA [Aquabacterium sp.]
MKQIEVSIMGQSYLLGCPEGGEARLKEAVSHVDREMCAIRDSGKLKARERIAVLSALNLAYELTERPAVTAPAASTTADSADVPSPEHVDRLIARIDQVLGQDGHLI